MTPSICLYNISYEVEQEMRFAGSLSFGCLVLTSAMSTVSHISAIPSWGDSRWGFQVDVPVCFLEAPTQEHLQCNLHFFRVGWNRPVRRRPYMQVGKKVQSPYWRADHTSFILENRFEDSVGLGMTYCLPLNFVLLRAMSIKQSGWALRHMPSDRTNHVPFMDISNNTWFCPHAIKYRFLPSSKWGHHLK